MDPVGSGTPDQGAIAQYAELDTLRRQASLMQAVFGVLARRDLSAGDRIQEILKSGCELFGEQVGIVSRIEGETYTVEHVYAPGTDLAPGQQFALGDTYCSITVNHESSLGIDHMGASEWADHPCYAGFQLESYIGVPIHVNGNPYGTLNFSSPEPVAAPFRDVDLEFIETLGSWLSGVLEQQSTMRSLEALATRDPLTGLANRLRFETRAERCIERAQHRDYDFAVVFLDLDGFKPVNDTHGHAAGDELLVQVGQRLEETVRTKDLVARIGGDEFVLLLEEVCREAAEATAERVAVALSRPFTLGEVEVSLGVSSGIACSSEHDTLAELVEAADAAMYRVKESRSTSR